MEIKIGGNHGCVHLLGMICLKASFFLIFLFADTQVRQMPTDELDDYTSNFDRNFKLRERPRSLLMRNSTPVVVDYQDDDGNWRKRIKMERIKFDDKAKGIFLDEYRKWGRIGESAARCGVTTGTVRKHMETDEEFAEAFLLAEEEYKEKLIGHHQDLVFNGTTKESYDRNGNLVSTEQVYPIRLIELELKKHDAGYRDKQEVQVNHTGGVLVTPAEMASVDDWEKRFSKAKDITPDDEDKDDPLQIEG
jgi:hypothetical protein